ncbi:MAG: hypothetical protein COB60_07320 [Flavobacteriaceae bacterium]|nr:MAG: hypothetical protein COB60_07320 [Flavobacteriaceae bacterium]
MSKKLTKNNSISEGHSRESINLYTRNMTIIDNDYPTIFEEMVEDSQEKTTVHIQEDLVNQKSTLYLTITRSKFQVLILDG